jgi:high-affinity iron transporter
MFPSFLLSLREGLEAALIIGIILGVLHKLHRNDLKPVVWRGVGLAVALSLLASLGLNLLGMEFEGVLEEVFEGIAMLLAAGILTWMILWMQRQGGEIRREIESKTRQASLQKGGQALFLLAFLAVFREGIELALFLMATRLATSPISTLVGAILGLIAAIALGLIVFSSTRRLNLRQFFLITNVLLLLFAAGLVAHGIHEFIEAGWVPAIIDPVWDINHILHDKSPVGEILKALFGYNGNPALTEAIAYFAYFAVLGTILIRIQRKQPKINALPVQ